MIQFADSKFILVCLHTIGTRSCVMNGCWTNIWLRKGQLRQRLLPEFAGTMVTLYRSIFAGCIGYSSRHTELIPTDSGNRVPLQLEQNKMGRIPVMPQHEAVEVVIKSLLLQRDLTPSLFLTLNLFPEVLLIFSVLSLILNIAHYQLSIIICCSSGHNDFPWHIKLQ